jgi:hypothetical protein
MKPLVQKIHNEVREVFLALSFFPAEGVFKEGEWAAIEIVPKRGATASLSDLQCRIIPYAQERDAPSEVVAGVLEACHEAFDDPNPSVRIAAQSYLNSWETAERVKSGDLDGWTISCYAETEPGVRLHLEEVTNQNGELWFRNVIKNSVCRLTLSEKSVQSDVERPAEVSPSTSYTEASWTMRLAAKSDQPLLRAESEAQTFSLLDGHIAGLLEETLDGSAVMTLETSVQEFAGATVRFFFGDDSGEVQLNPAEPGTGWSGQIQLRHQFKKVIAETPSFEIIPARKK